jgi:TPR repeat protein
MKALFFAIFASIAGVALAADKENPVIKQAAAAAGKGDYNTAYKLVRGEAERGEPAAANIIGEMTMAGRGVAASPEEAARWFEKAVAAKFPAAQLNLARLLRQGIGKPKDEERAKFLVLQAAEAGFAPAQVEHGRMLEAAVDLKARSPDFSEARKWIEKAAAQGYPDALFALVRYTDEGLAGPADPVAATKLCRRAAQGGSGAAMNDMGVRYQKGTGVEMDNVAAVGWFTLATQHEVPAAYVNLGNCYELGNGLKRDYSKAGQYYATAARRGFPIASALLGHLFEEGLGTDVDLVKAYAMYKRAADAGFAQAAPAVEKLGSKLTAEMKAAAVKIAADGITIPGPTRSGSNSETW